MATYPLGHGLASSTWRTVDKASTSFSPLSSPLSTIQLKRKNGSAKSLNLCSSSFPCLPANKGSNLRRLGPVSCHDVSTEPSDTIQYEVS